MDQQTAAWVAGLIEAVQPHLPETVLAATVLRPAGTGTGGEAASVSSGTGFFRGKPSRPRAGDLPGTTLLALTASRIFAFEGPPTGAGGKDWKVRREAVVWDRADVRVRSRETSSWGVSLEVVSTGERYELEPAGAAGRAVTEAFLQVLTEPAARLVFHAG